MTVRMHKPAAAEPPAPGQSLLLAQLSAHTQLILALANSRSGQLHASGQTTVHPRRWRRRWPRQPSTLGRSVRGSSRTDTSVPPYALGRKAELSRAHSSEPPPLPCRQLPPSSEEVRGRPGGFSSLRTSMEFLFRGPSCQGVGAHAYLGELRV